MIIPEKYREIARNKGRSLQQIGASGVGFTREHALQALDCLKGSQAVVLGGDVIEVADKELRFTYDSWHIDKKIGESILQFVERSIMESENYIRNYPDTGDGRILYSLIVSELGI